MDTALLVLHGLVGLLFMGHGAQKLFGVFGGSGLDATAGFMESLGLQPARLHAWAAGLAEFTGGVLLALGLFTPVGAALIIAVMVTASVTAHPGKLWNAVGGMELPLVFVATAFALATIGAGDVSLDSAFDLDLTGLGWGLAALAAGVAGGFGSVLLGRAQGRHSSGPQAQGA